MQNMIKLRVLMFMLQYTILWRLCLLWEFLRVAEASSPAFIFIHHVQRDNRWAAETLQGPASARPAHCQTPSFRRSFAPSLRYTLRCYVSFLANLVVGVCTRHTRFLPAATAIATTTKHVFSCSELFVCLQWSQKIFNPYGLWFVVFRITRNTSSTEIKCKKSIHAIFFVFVIMRDAPSHEYKILSWRGEVRFVRIYLKVRVFLNILLTGHRKTKVDVVTLFV